MTTAQRRRLLEITQRTGAWIYTGRNASSLEALERAGYVRLAYRVTGSRTEIRAHPTQDGRRVAENLRRS